MEFIFDVVSGLQVFIVLYWIKGYIYLDFHEVSPKKIKMLIPFNFTMCVLMNWMFESQRENIAMLLLILNYLISVCVLLEKHRVRGILQWIPEFGMMAAISMTPNILMYFVIGDMEHILDAEGFSFLQEFVGFWIIWFYFWLKWRKRQDITKLVSGKRLNKKERRLLNFCGTCMFIFVMISMSIDECGIAKEYRKLSLFLFLFIIWLMLGIIVTLVGQRNQRFQYQNIAEMNAYYLNAELEHFRSYEAAQKETRKVKHDMKNHMYVLKQFIEEGKQREAQEYLEQLTEQVERIENPVVTGNEIVDSIINAKNAMARQAGNQIVVEGRISSKFAMNPIDLCTIFSNAIDNALEEMKRNHEENGTLEITLYRQNDMQMILFQNPTRSARIEGTSKQNKRWHGFGLENIRETVENYQGMMQIRIEEGETHNLFLLEIIIPDESFTTK